jgi:hypothetical protein
MDSDLESVEKALHRLVRAVGPDLRIERKWAHDWYAGTDLVLCIGRFRHHVGVEFWRGSALAPRFPGLEGTGKNLRHLKVRSLTEAKAATTRSLLAAAIRLDRASPKRSR